MVWRQRFSRRSSPFACLPTQIESRGKEDPLTCLIPRLEDVDPDDAFSSVPYEKGHALLWHLETLLGGPGECRTLRPPEGRIRPL